MFQLFHAPGIAPTGNRRPGGFGPVIDGTVLPRHPFDPEAPAISKNKPLIVGTTGRTASSPGPPTEWGAAHALEIRYKFNLVARNESEGAQGAEGGCDLMAISGPDSVKTAHNMSELWSTFARTGRPAAQGQPAWPAYTPNGAQPWRSTRSAGSSTTHSAPNVGCGSSWNHRYDRHSTITLTVAEPPAPTGLYCTTFAPVRR
jgi:carboxylesterase type B